MKFVFWGAVTIMLFGNFGLMLRGEGMLINAGLTPDKWSRVCTYYYPIRTFRVEFPLNDPCPNSASAR